jgi:hypothetical protein
MSNDIIEATPMKRKVTFKPGWSAAPRGIVGRLDRDGKSKPGILAKFNAAEAKLYFVLADACKWASEIRVSNEELIKATGLDDRSLRRARSSLENVFGVIYAKPADGRRETYIYSVSRSGPSVKTEPVTVNVMPGSDTVTVVPDVVLHAVLSQPATLEGRRTLTPATSPNIDPPLHPARESEAAITPPAPSKLAINMEYLPPVRKKAANRPSSQ